MQTEDHEVPYRLRTIAGEWYDGGNSAMLRFSRQEPYDAVKLHKETEAALSVCVDGVQRVRLGDLEAFAAGEARRQKARAKLEAAVIECFRSGAEDWQIGKAFDRAFRAAAAAVEREARSGDGGPAPRA